MAVFKFSHSNIGVLAFIWYGDLRSKPVITGIGEVPFIVWMLAGLIPCLFIRPTILDGSNSVFKRINIVAQSVQCLLSRLLQIYLVIL